jgi:hypothetical protein
VPGAIRNSFACGVDIAKALGHFIGHELDILGTHWM